MRTNKYRNHSIFNLLELDLSQRKHQERLWEIDRTRRQIKSNIRQNAREYEQAHQQQQAIRLAAHLHQDAEKVTLINQMNRKINLTIER
jgi:hypothetical protein